MHTAKVFQSGNSQAIRIPKEFHTDNKEFLIREMGGCLFLLPPDDPWALLKQTIGSFEEDLQFERDQPLLSDLPIREEVD